MAKEVISWVSEVDGKVFSDKETCEKYDYERREDADREIKSYKEKLEKCFGHKMDEDGYWHIEFEFITKHKVPCARSVHPLIAFNPFVEPFLLPVSENTGGIHIETKARQFQAYLCGKLDGIVSQIILKSLQFDSVNFNNIKAIHFSDYDKFAEYLREI